MKEKKWMKGKWWWLLLVFLVTAGCGKEDQKQPETTLNHYSEETIQEQAYAQAIPEYQGEPYVILNENEPYFTEAEITDSAFESYGSLDELGRCTAAQSCIGKELMPLEERGSIGQIKPSGWQTMKYDIVDGKYLYNRCHLIGFQLTGENANEKNLITGTRYLNVEGMLPFENMVADYIKETGNHVMYRVTPVFQGEELIARGVRIEARSVEDEGEGILFHVYCYNVQPGIEIDYDTGDSWLKEDFTEISGEVPEETSTETSVIETPITETPVTETPKEEKIESYVWVSETGSKYHNKPDCGRMNPERAKKVTESQAKQQGLEACKKCFP